MTEWPGSLREKWSSWSWNLRVYDFNGVEIAAAAILHMTTEELFLAAEQQRALGTDDRTNIFLGAWVLRESREVVDALWPEEMRMK